MMTAEQIEHEFSSNDYFKMGAVVAIGELMDENWLDDGVSTDDIRTFIASFGVTGFDDMRAIGMGSVYLQDFERLYAEVS